MTHLWMMARSERRLRDCLRRSLLSFLFVREEKSHSIEDLLRALEKHRALAQWPVAGLLAGGRCVEDVTCCKVSNVSKLAGRAKGPGGESAVAFGELRSGTRRRSWHGSAWTSSDSTRRKGSA